MNWSKISFDKLCEAMTSLGFIHVINQDGGGPPVETDIRYFYNPELKEGLYLAVGTIYDDMTFDEYFQMAVHEQFGDGHGKTKTGELSK